MVRLSMASKSWYLRGRWLITISWLCALLLPAAVHAQAQVRFSSANVDLLPEYDRPGVLVIYQLKLASDTVLPVQLTLSLPAKAQIWAVAVADATGTLLDVAYTSKTQADLTALSFASDSLTIQVEYYDALVKNGTARHVQYNWRGDYAVGALTVSFQSPAGATNLSLSPPSVSSTTGQGFTHYQTSAVSLAAGQTFSLTADYQRQTDALSFPPAQAPASPSLLQNLLDQLGTGMPAGLLLGLLGVLLVIAALIGLFFWQRNRPSTTPRTRHARSSALGKAPDEAVYCTACGRLASPQDVFCRQCGARLRRMD